MRVVWPPKFPALFTHKAWKSDDSSAVTLGGHRLYKAAKKNRDVKSALQLCDEIYDEQVMNSIYDTVFDAARGAVPIVVAPAPTLGETQNALAYSYAGWLAKQMGWEFSTTIFQRKTSSRDFVSDNWIRLVNEPSFYGSVDTTRPYVIADDVCTQGGTMASLRSFIESQGGHVTCMTTLACHDGRNAQISLAPGTLARLIGVDGGSFARTFREEMGYDLHCLTEFEGRFLSRCQTANDLRKGIHGARGG